MTRLLRRPPWLALLAACLLALFPLAVTGQDAPSAEPYGYDADALAMIEGKVTAVVEVASRGPDGAVGVHLTLQTADGDWRINLGPKWYLERQAMHLRVGDRIAVTGSKIGQQTLTAAEIRRGDARLLLRETDGLPRWRGTAGPANRVRWQRAVGWGPDSVYGRTSWTDAVALKGTILLLTREAPQGCRQPGVILTLDTGEAAETVVLGPAWFIERQGVRLEPGDAVEVEGARVKVGDKQLIAATRVQRGDDALALRNSDGGPAWCTRQRVRPQPPGPQLHGRYDPTTVETVTGKVAAVTRTAGKLHGVHLTVQGEAGPREVFLGPSWYIDRLGLGLQPGDTVEVTGSRVEVEGQMPALIAAALSKGDQVLMLRDPMGIPFWSGWRRNWQGAPGQ